ERVAGRVLEVGELQAGARGHGGQRHLAAVPLGLRADGVDVLDHDQEHRVPAGRVVLIRDASRAPGGSGVADHVLTDAAGVDLDPPAEQVAVEAARLLRRLGADLEPRDGVVRGNAHRSPLSNAAGTSVGERRDNPLSVFPIRIRTASGIAPTRWVRSPAVRNPQLSVSASTIRRPRPFSSPLSASTCGRPPPAPSSPTSRVQKPAPPNRLTVTQPPSPEAVWAMALETGSLPTVIRSSRTGCPGGSRSRRNRRAYPRDRGTPGSLTVPCTTGSPLSSVQPPPYRTGRPPSGLSRALPFMLVLSHRSRPPLRPLPGLADHRRERPADHRPRRTGRPPRLLRHRGRPPPRVPPPPRHPQTRIMETDVRVPDFRCSPGLGQPRRGRRRDPQLRAQHRSWTTPDSRLCEEDHRNRQR